MVAVRISRWLPLVFAAVSSFADAQPLSGTVQVAAGGDFSCALTNTGAVKCWGLGYGASPADVPSLSTGVQAIAAGGAHACALTAAGGVKCWNVPGAFVPKGNLGDGTTNVSTTPVDVVGLASGVTAIDAGGGQTCAVLASGGLKCWGVNVWGEVGNGTFDGMGNPVTAPVDVVGLSSGVTAVATGGSHTCAIVNGGVKCWGYAGQGQMGDGRGQNGSLAQLTPLDVPGLATGVVAVTAGGYHSCTLMGSGAVKCWGNAYGDPAGSQVPVDIPGLSGVATLSAGGSHTCANSQTVVIGVPFVHPLRCWGSNTFGELGDLTLFARELPVEAYDILAHQVSAGSGHTCALSAGAVKCWGRNHSGSIGNGAVAPAWPYPSVAGNFAQQQAITFPGGLAPQPAGGAPFGVAATASSGLPTSFASTTPSSCTVSGSTVTPGAMGICTLVALQPGDATRAAAAPVTHSFMVQGSTIPRLANLSTRMQFEVAAGNDLIAGFVIGGSQPKTVVIRAMGPSLAAHGVTNPHPDPYLMVFEPARRRDNDNWQVLDVQFMQPIPNPDAQRIEEIGFAPGNALEATMIRTLKPGAYTAMIPVRAAGIGILELYELDRPESPLINISSRGPVRAGDGRMIAGFVIQGDSPRTVAIVGTGPSLAAHGVADPLGDPTITLVRSSDQAIVATNDNWSTTPGAQQLVDKGLAPTNPLESAVLVTLQPGAYTALLGGTNGSTGTGVIGVYEVQ